MFKFATRIDVFSRAGFSAPGKQRLVNEDNYSVIGNTIVLIDGATAVLPLTKSGFNAAAYTSRWVATFVKKYTANAPHLKAEELLHALLRHFRKHLRDDWPEAYKAGVLGPSAAIAVVRFHEDGLISYASLSDCRITARKKDGAHVLLSDLDEAHATCDNEGKKELYAYANRLGIPASEAATHDEAKEIGYRNRLNVNKRFYTFNATEEATKGIYAGTISGKDITHISLFSDGMETPEAEGLDAILKAAALMCAMGLKSTWQFFKAMYDKDPKWEKHHRGKHMDDATAILVTLHPRFKKCKKAA